MGQQTSPRSEIAEVDRQIDANRAEIRSLVKIRPLSAGSWQRAWDKHPDLYARDRALFCRRGELQALRDAADAKAQRRFRAPKIKFTACPTCGSHILREAA